MAYWLPFIIISIFSSRVFADTVKAVTPNLNGRFGGSVALKWEVSFVLSTTKINQVELFHGSTSIAIVIPPSTIGSIPPRLISRVSLKGSIDAVDIKASVIISIDKLQYNDTGTYRLQVTTNTVAKYNSLIKLTVRGSPLSCGNFSLPPSPYDVVENKPYDFKVSLCGNPQPTVKWYVGSIEDMSDSSNTTSDVNIREFIYEKQVTKYTPDLCGKKVGYNATGADGYLEKSVTINLLFTPDMVTDISSNQGKEDDQITTTWDFKMNTGLCKVQYEIHYNNNNNITVATANTTNSEKSLTQRFSSEAERDSVKYVQVRTTYKSKNSHWTDHIQVSLDPPTTTAATTVIKAVTASPRSGDDNMGVIAGGVVGGIIFIIIIMVIVVCVMKKKKNERKPRARYDEMDMASRNVRTANENDYAAPHDMVPAKQASGCEDTGRHDNPDQMVYAELGAGGGRTGPRPAPAQSNYAEVKLDGMGYPAEGPSSRKSTQSPTYAVVDKTRRHSPPPSDNEDDYSGVVV